MYKKQKVELVVIRNPFNPTPKDIEIYAGKSLEVLIKRAFPRGLGKNIKLYDNSLAPQYQIPLETQQDVVNLLNKRGRIYAQVIPTGLDPISWLVIGVSVLVSVAVSYFLTPKIANGSSTQTQAPSPNNSLTSRQNQQRLGGRIPDIFGKVWSIPDLIAPTYSVYVDHEEVEFSYMAVGRGEYEIHKVLDDASDFQYLSGATAKFYKPNKSFRYDAPFLQVGADYSSRELELSGLYAKRYSAINGQVLHPPDNFVIGDKNIRAKSNGTLEITNNGANFDVEFEVGDTLTISGADNVTGTAGYTVSIVETDPDTGEETTRYETHYHNYNLNGDFVISSVSESSISLQDPAAISSEWARLSNNADTTEYDDFVLSTTGTGIWTEWTYLDGGQFTDAMINFVALNGIYVKKGENQTPAWVKIGIESELVDENKDPISGTSYYRETVIYAKNAEKYHDVANNRYYPTTDDSVMRTAALTAFANNPNHALGTELRIRFKRVSPRYAYKNNQNVDEVKVKDLYGIAAINNSSYYPDLTTVYVKQKATSGALSIKERKFKALVTRKVKDYRSGDALIASNKTEDVLYHVATDEKIGRLMPEQLDMVQIQGELDAQRVYFGHDRCAQFNATFDDNNISSKESIAAIAEAAFCTAYKFNKLSLYFERPKDFAVAVFNSTNIIPKTYQHSESCGITNDYDGVTVKYKDPYDGTEKTLKHPSDGSAVNPDEKRLFGVADDEQARVHMMRQWNRHVFAHKTIEFTGGDESNVVVLRNKIQVVNQHRLDTYDGYVEDIRIVRGEIILTMSSAVDPSKISEGTLFLQMINGQVDAMAVVVVDRLQLKLPRMPYYDISADKENVVQCAYQLVEYDNDKRDSFIVTAKSPEQDITNQISAINYDARYYKDDKTI